MTTRWTILALSDLHIPVERGQRDHVLRGEHFDEYIGALARCHHEERLPSPQAIVISGDIVHQPNGDAEPYKRARAVIDELARAFSLLPGNVVLCPGNHDVLRGESDATVARAQFWALANDYGNAVARSSRNRFVVHELEPDMLCLVVDTTLDASQSGFPGNIKTGEVDEIMTSLKRRWRAHPDELQIVSSHHPPLSATAGIEPFGEGRDDWVQRHIWSRGTPLRERISREREGKATLWHSGDIHSPLALSSADVHYLTTGRFGTAAAVTRTEREAALITISTSECRLNRLYFTSTPHTDHDHDLGQWEVADAYFDVYQSREQRRRSSQSRPRGPSPEVPGAEPPAAPPEVIDAGVEANLVEFVGSHRLYRTGHFGYDTSASIAYLSWISLGPIFNNSSAFNDIIRTFVDHVDKTLGTQTTTLVGVDCLGAILASQISVRTGHAAYCISSRQTETELEGVGVSPELTTAAERSQALVYVTDVAVTGGMLCRIRDEVECYDRPEQTVYLLSVFTDTRRPPDVGGIPHFTVCGRFRFLTGSRDDFPADLIT